MTCHEQGNYQGDCCCQCKWQVKINKHPWNKKPLFKGSIFDTIAFGCSTPELESIILFENRHGFCEVFTQKENDK